MAMQPSGDDTDESGGEYVSEEVLRCTPSVVPDIRKAKMIVTALALQHIPEALACGAATSIAALVMPVRPGVAFGAAANGTNTTWSEAVVCVAQRWRDNTFLT